MKYIIEYTNKQKIIDIFAFSKKLWKKNISEKIAKPYKKNNINKYPNYIYVKTYLTIIEFPIACIILKIKKITK